EERRVAWRATVERVATGVFVGAVRLDLHEPRRDAVAHQHLVEQLGCDREGIAVEELPRQRASHVCWRSIRSRACTSWCATGSGPAPPGVVRRRTALPGSRNAT